jgi:hypothetical protein
VIWLFALNLGLFELRSRSLLGVVVILVALPLRQLKPHFASPKGIGIVVSKIQHFLNPLCSSTPRFVVFVAHLWLRDL